MNKTAIYCRISGQMQMTDRQEEELRNFAKQQNLYVADKNIYIDIVSGYSHVEDRQQYSKMLEDIETDNITTILFSELTRLGRNSTELLTEIQRLQDKNISLYFQKQDIWAKRRKDDIGFRILLAVLAITATYEIELFAERSISGKINKINNGGGIGGDNNAYGYRNDENKKMAIREDEAEIVRRIYNMYANGKSTIEICDILNTENIPTAYTTRKEEYEQNRKKKGLPPKEYNYSDKLLWRPNVVSRILSNKLYTGYRNTIFHKPQPNKQGKDKNEREIIHEYSAQIEYLRIIDDELFFLVQKRLSQAKYNKNIAIKHENLLKHKMVCGECGANFSVGKSTDTAKNYISGGRSYKCYGRVNRKDKPQTCKFGAEVRQWKLDGLVVSLSLYMFAERNIIESNRERIKQLEKEINEYKKIIENKNKELEKLTENYKRSIKRLSNVPKNDEVIQELINEEQNNYLNTKDELEISIAKYEKEIISRNLTAKKLRELSVGFSNIKDKMDEIRNSKELVKNMIDEYIDKVFIYKIHKMWNLVIVKYTTGEEFWGTIKSARYKKNEMFFDASVCKYGVEFHAWFLNNCNKCFTYNKEERTITYNGESDIYTEISAGKYTFDEMNKILYNTGWIGSYPFYIYENNSSTPPQSPNT